MNQKTQDKFKSILNHMVNLIPHLHAFSMSASKYSKYGIEVALAFIFKAICLPPYLRRTKSIEELIPWLYLKGLSANDYSEALGSLLGEHAKGLSPNTVSRLKSQWLDEHQTWQRQDLSQKCYVYWWADGIL